MEPRPPEQPASRRKKSLKKHPEYDIEQLDLQWLPKIQQLCHVKEETIPEGDALREEKDEIDFSVPLTSYKSKKDQISGRGSIDVRQLKDHLKQMSRADLGNICLLLFLLGLFHYTE